MVCQYLGIMRRSLFTIFLALMMSALFLRTVRADGECLSLTPMGVFQAKEDHQSASALTAFQCNTYPASRALIGDPGQHIVKKRETLLDVARQHGLGFNEMRDLYPELDPWLLQEGMVLTIPSQWIPPLEGFRGIVINVAELRLYYYYTGQQPRVMTFPVGVGDRDWPTPVGDFKVREKRMHPTWFIPPSLKEKYKAKTIRPGPDNPLGDYWIGIGDAYGIHGTDMPWSVGRLVTRGCIRLYPEDIRLLFNAVPIGTPVRMIYEPVKISQSGDRVVVEVHEDVYGYTGDLTAYGCRCLEQKGLAHRVDMPRFLEALSLHNGMPVDVTRHGSEEMTSVLHQNRNNRFRISADSGTIDSGLVLLKQGMGGCKELPERIRSCQITPTCRE